MGRPRLIETQAILEAARDTFLVEGVGATTGAIARRAGISEATIFKRFRTKADLFFAAMGLLVAFYGGITNFGIDGYPPKDALLLALLDVITWTLVGLVVAWRMRPEPETLRYPQTVRA